ncbi:MAG: urease accessory protein [Mycobacterium sp.]|jgi:urease accessory protein|nr:urease accessory protein [Mycobacterium sp.]
MHSEVLVVAHPDRLPRLEYRGGIAARSTLPDTVHLLSALATPFGGDTINVRVVVEPRARLVLRSVSAKLVLPDGDATTSHSHFELEVAGSLDLDLEPTVVAANSRHLASLTLQVSDGGRIRLRERVQIGRCNESGQGFWSDSLRADVCDRPLVRHHVEMGAGETVSDATLRPARAYIGELRYPANVVGWPPHATATVLELPAGGVLTTWRGDRLA